MEDKEKYKRAKKEILSNKEIKRKVKKLSRKNPEWNDPKGYWKLLKIRDELWKIGCEIWSKHMGQPFGGAAYDDWVIDIVKGRDKGPEYYKALIYRRTPPSLYSRDPWVDD